MLPPVFYVQQLEQILLRKLLSPPTPAARPLRFLPAPPLSFPAPRARPSRRICAYIHIQFFVCFSRVEPRPLISRVCAAHRCLFLHPAPVLPAASALISVFSFCSFFSCRAASIDLARLRCAPDALTSIFSFCQPFPFQAALLWLRVRHILFSRFSVFLRPVFPPVL